MSNETTAAAPPPDEEKKPAALTRRKSMSGEPDKTVGINNPEKNRVNFTGTNYIRTSKYTIISFLPLNLLEQFRRVANCYFLVTAVITTIRGVTRRLCQRPQRCHFCLC